LIEDQIQAAHIEIEKEKQEFMLRKLSRLADLGITTSPPRPGTASNAAGPAHSNKFSLDTEPSGDETVQADALPRHERSEEHGDVVVEGQEDTVIY
jgi:hypothetical protein